MNYLFHLLVLASVWVIIAISLNIVFGYCGLVTLAHAGYFAIGAYTYALITLKLGWGLELALPIAVLIAVVASLFISLPAWRFKGDSFVMVSLAVQAMLFSLARNWSQAGEEYGTWANLTNGLQGISGIPRPNLFGLELDTGAEVALIALLIAGVCILLVWLLLKSPFGRLLKSIRDDELAARGLGKHVRWIKLQAFAIACGLAAVAGVIYAFQMRYVDPSICTLDQSILMLSMVVVGGTGNFRGPLLGAIVLLAIPEALRFVSIPDLVAANMRLLIYGIALILIMHFRPQGLIGEYRIE